MVNRNFAVSERYKNHMQRFLHILLSLLGGAFWTMLMLGFSDIKMTALTITAALIHECGHIIMLLLFRKKFSLPALVSSGFRIKTKSSFSYSEEILICAAGPLINVIMFIFFMPHHADFAIINLATAISNLLPLPEYDGYKIISDAISLIFGNQISDCVMPHITVLICSVIVLLSLFLIMILNGGYWIFFIFFIVLVKEITFFHKDVKNENL